MKSEQIQKTLPECTEVITKRDPTGKYYTRYFEVSTTTGQIEKINERCDKETPQGMPVFNKHEKKLLKMIWVQKRMRCVSARPIFREQWGDSALAIYHKIFEEEYK